MQAVRLHLAECPSCRLEYQSLADTKRVLASLANRASRAEIEALLTMEGPAATAPRSGSGAGTTPFRGLLRPRPLAATALLSVAGLWLATTALDSGSPDGSDSIRDGFPPAGMTAAASMIGSGTFFPVRGVSAAAAMPASLAPTVVVFPSGGGTVAVSSLPPAPATAVMQISGVGALPASAAVVTPAGAAGSTTVVSFGVASSSEMAPPVMMRRAFPPAAVPVHSGVIFALTTPTVHGSLFISR